MWVTIAYSPLTGPAETCLEKQSRYFVCMSQVAISLSFAPISLPWLQDVILLFSVFCHLVLQWQFDQLTISVRVWLVKCIFWSFFIWPCLQGMWQLFIWLCSSKQYPYSYLFVYHCSKWRQNPPSFCFNRCRIRFLIYFVVHFHIQNQV